MGSRILWLPVLLGAALSLACGLRKGDVDYGVCPDYLACSAATGTPTATLEAQYGEDGLCWDGEEDEATLCRAACEDGLTALASSFPAEPACAEPGTPDRTTDWGMDDCRNEIVPTGTSEGDVLADFALPDQNGDTVHLWDFCDRAVLLMVDAAWNDSAGGWAPHLQGLQEDFGDRGLVILTLLGENMEGEDPNTQDLLDYAEMLGVGGPVLADPGFATAESIFSNLGAIPGFVLLTQGAEVFETDDRDSIYAPVIEEALP